MEPFHSLHEKTSDIESTFIHEDSSPGELDMTMDHSQELEAPFWDSHSPSDHAILQPAQFHHADDSHDEIIGRRFSRYRCDALLGQGGMGRVYLAYHSQLGRPCALKVSSPSASQSLHPNWLATLQEGRSAAKLIHPHIVTVHAVGQEAGRFYIEMELISGGSLKNWIKQQGATPTLKALQWISSIGSGIDFAHRHGILHRDIKPDNILVCSRGQAKLADFGLARRNDLPDVYPQGQIIGTMPYLAPEVLQTGEHSTASDVYALGISLYYLLTGQLPYNGKTHAEIAHRILTTKPLDLRELQPEIPLSVAECVTSMMSKDSLSRPNNGTAAWHLVSSILGQMRDVDTILSEALGYDSSISWIRCHDKYRLMVQLPDGRKQRVFVESSDHRNDEKLLLIYSICCPATESYYETALRLNSDLSHGGLAIREIDGISHFVMVDTYPRGTVDPEEVRKSVRLIAETADSIEKQLTNADQN